MGGIGIHRARWVTAFAVAGALSWSSMVLPVRASSPFSKPAAGAAISHPPHPASTPFSRPAVGAASSRPPHLDLRPPSARELGDFPGASADRPSWGRPRTPGGRESNLPALGADAGEVRTMSRVESFARRVHREGLPLARLWENHSALVSVGLNAKGKPGLWLVQKTR
jgi:hypothetical protein